MNKQEAIEKINESRLAFAAILSRRNGKSSYFEKEVVVMKEEELVDIINQIDEPEKPVIPQFVAEWIEYCKKNNLTIAGAFDPVSEHGIGLAETYGGNVYGCTRWTLDNQDIFARAWLDGYEVEEEKQYTARLKVVTIKKAGYLNRHNKNGSITIDTSYTAGGQYQVYFTRSELEELNVWDNPAFEIEEVE